MKLPAITTILTLLLLTACQPATKDTKKTTTTNNDFRFNQKVAHSFSDLNTKDMFEVNLTGSKPADMVLTFTITNAKGAEIYKVNIKATELLGSADPNINLRSEADQITFIKNIATDFLSEENFLVPAVTGEQVADEYTPDKEFHKELKNNGLNGFTYRLGKENNLYIAWSVTEKKVKTYYNCC